MRMLLDMKDAFALLAALHDLMPDERATLRIVPHDEERVTLTLMNQRTDKWDDYVIEDADLEKPIAQLAAEIHALHTETT